MKRKLRFLDEGNLLGSKDSKTNKRVVYGRRKPIYSIGYKPLSELHKYYKTNSGNKVHVLTFGLINANIFIKKLRK